jgi:molybdopterin/thiamine biosynthesis adenylyltransferase
MALADYFHRSAVAASQVVAGFDEEAIRDRLQTVHLGVSVGDAETSQGQHLLDMTVRLLARLYPTLVLDGDTNGTAATLAREINPNIELTTGRADFAVAIGANASEIADTTIFAGSDGWLAHVGTNGPFPVGAETNPFGAGASACLAAANVFRAVFMGDAPQLDETLVFSTLNYGSTQEPHLTDGLDVGEAVLVGAGAIGQSALWALTRAALNGRLHVVDPEPIELSNLQRYVLAARSDEGEPKIAVLPKLQSSSLRLAGHELDWQHFCQQNGYAWERVLVALDSAADRRAVQASLPRWIANAWTQPGDLGCSVHPWSEEGACLCCLYLPDGQTPNEDELIAQALGLQGMELEVRRLLFTRQPVPAALLPTIEQHLELPEGGAAAFAGRPLRDLYVDGVCGGALIALDKVGRPHQGVHVPIAHQSALAGILLACRLVADVLGAGPSDTSVARIDIMRALGDELAQRAQKDARGICICQDPVYRSAYDTKWR